MNLNLNPFDPMNGIQNDTALDLAVLDLVVPCFDGKDSMRIPKGDALVGHVLSLLRAARGWSRFKLAREAGMNPVYIALLEMGYIDGAEVPRLVWEAVNRVLALSKRDMIAYVAETVALQETM